MKIAVLGAGMVGRTIATDLSKNFNVTSFDISEKNMAELQSQPMINCRKADLSLFANYPELLKDDDLVVSAVPGFLGYRALEAILRAGKNVVDISFFPENALELDALAKKNNVTAIVDCGVAPGMSNFILGYLDTKMKISNFECLVGGLPKTRIKPFEYKAPFSPIDVIEEYTRPARFVENGKIVTRPAMSETELIDFDKVGTLESFNTDGLRSILFTMSHIPNMKEKTLRYPGHIDFMKALLKAGFFSRDAVTFGEITIRPIDFTSHLLFDKWKLQPKEEEFTIMTLVIDGEEDEKKIRVKYFLYDEYDAASGTSSMSRTTGYTCTAAIHLLANGLFTSKGIYPPEIVGKNEACFDFVLNYLSERNIIYEKSVTSVE